MNLSVITAAIPSLHRFLNDLQHGGVSARITEHQYELSVGSSNGLSSKLGLGSRTGNTSRHHHKGGKNSSQPSSAGGGGSGVKLSSRIFSDHHASQAMGRRHERNRIPEEASTSSLTNNGVMQTWEISIEVEDKEKGAERSIATTAASSQE
jgi:hypothetical protein